MGNRNANEEQNNNININGGVHEHILIQNDNNNNNNSQAKIDPPSVKKVYAVRNPIFIKKTSLVLEKDAGPSNLYYIKFNYDSLVNFNCYINFEVSKNYSKPLVPKEIPNAENYILSYMPSINFVSKSIAIRNLPKGENMEFFEKDAVIDIDYFKNNKSQNDNNEKEKIYDVSIELVPILDENNDNKNEIVYLSLCNLEQKEDLERHPHCLKIELQKLKTYGMWIDIHDIYNSSLDNGECLICCTNLRNTIFLPCYHACTCNTCAHSLKMRNNPCPICKINIKDLLILEVDEKVNNVNLNNNNLNMNYEDEEKNELKNADVLDVNENNNIMNENNYINQNDNDEEERKKINEE
jgi:hypothetical protein